MIRILIVDDQNLIRQGIKVLLQNSPDIEIVGEFQDGESVLQTIATLGPDIVLLDIELPGIDGLTVVKKISLEFPQIKVIMLSSYEDKSYVNKATASGAKGYLLKNVSAEELSWSIKLVYQGYSAFKSELLTELTPEQKSESVTSSTLKRQTVQQRDISPSPKTSASSNTAMLQEAKMADMEALLTKNHIHQKYAKYPDYNRQHGKNRVFYNPRLNKLKKTVTSFEFKLLVFVILFSLGFLVFVALS